MGQSSQVHIQQLFQSGVATHIVENKATIDPIFALSKVRDFPEVTFAAAFDDGIVVLGCAGQLPDQLARIAQPIIPKEPAPPNGVGAKLDALIARLDQSDSDNASQDRIGEVLATFEQQQTMIAALQDQISNMQISVETAVQNSAASSTEDPRFDMLQGKLEQLIDNNGSVSDFDSALQQLSHMRADMAEVLSLAKAPSPPDLSRQTTDIAPTQQMIEQALNRVSNDVKALIAMHGAAGTQGDIQSEISELKTKLEDLPALTAIDAKLDQLTLALNEIVDAHSHANAFDDAQLGIKIDALATDIAAMSQQPSTEVDLATQRQTFAKFLTAMGTVIARLEQTVTDVATLGAANKSADTQQLQQKIDTVCENLAPIRTMSTQLADLNSTLAPLPAQGDRILHQLSNLDTRTDPTNAEAAQRRSLAYFVHAIETIVSRVEGAADGIRNAPQQTDFAPHLDQIETYLATVATQESQNDVLARITTQHDELRALRSDIATFHDRPAPVLDLTAQRASFAQFATALQTVLGRFEKIAAHIEQPVQDRGISGEAAEIEQDPNGPPFSDVRVSLQDLRKDFAELIAKQIMQNTVHAIPSPDQEPDRQS
ncbi:hypothetical protein [Yoonia sp.]|uniref:hypothetical protein n=1 Tax=Yoonia sp. TaxID=2212373 RepID=UPI00358DF4BF